MLKNIFSKTATAIFAAIIVFTCVGSGLSAHASTMDETKSLSLSKSEYYKLLDDANQNRQTKSDYALLYYDAIKNRTDQITAVGETFIDAEMVDFHMDGTYELVAYFENKDDKNPYARIMVYPTEGLLPSKDNNVPTERNPIWDMQFSTHLDQDIYITEYKGRPALAKSRTNFGYIQLYWIDEDGTVKETVIREKGMWPSESGDGLICASELDDRFICVEGLINSYKDDREFLYNNETIEKYRVSDDMYYECTKPISTWGIKADDPHRNGYQDIVDASKKAELNIEVTYGERLLEYIYNAE